MIKEKAGKVELITLCYGSGAILDLTVGASGFIVVDRIEHRQ